MKITINKQLLILTMICLSFSGCQSDIDKLSRTSYELGCLEGSYYIYKNQYRSDEKERMAAKDHCANSYDNVVNKGK